MDIRTPVATCYGENPSKFAEIWKNQMTRLQARFSSAVEETRMPPEHPVEVPVVYVRKDTLIGVLSFMKTEQGFEYGFLSDITAIDQLGGQEPGVESGMPRFEVVYNLYSLSTKARIRVKTRVADGEEVPTAIPIWPGANWVEREVWDMFGIRFTGHPDLRRILMDERWEDFPLRKDYPLRGYQVFTEPEAINQELLD